MMLVVYLLPEAQESIYRTMNVHTDRSYQVNPGNDCSRLSHTAPQRLPIDIWVLVFLVENARPRNQLPQALFFAPSFNA
jgi:hypothetical protein